jgi:hypothetical protein
MPTSPDVTNNFAHQMHFRNSTMHEVGVSPQPISTAPACDNTPLLLYCLEQGGWHTGVWFLGKWLAYIDTSVVLKPTHWLPLPADPPATECLDATHNV